VNQDDPEVSDYALDGLKQMMVVKSRVVLPYLIPQVRPSLSHSIDGLKHLHLTSKLFG